MSAAYHVVHGSPNLQLMANEELLERRSSRKLRIVMGVISGVIFIVLLTIMIIMLVNNAQSSPFYPKQQGIKLEDLLRGHYAPRSFNGTWISGNEILYMSELGDILLYNTNDLSTTTIFSADHPILERAGDPTLSADRRYLLIPHEQQKLFRHSFIARYAIADLETKTVIPLDAEGDPFFQLAVWAPVGNGIVFVSQNNIFYKNSVLTHDVRKITNDGVIGEVYNGVPDWVYEEEVLSSNKALWISPDGKKVAYAKFNDKDVKVMTLPVYGEPGHPIFQYTKVVQIRYPKCGTPNPVVTLHVADLEDVTAPILKLDVPEKLTIDPVLASVVWATPSVVVAIWKNRVQNEGAIVSYPTNGHQAADIVLELKQSNGWLDLFTPPIVSKDGSKMLLILSHKQKQKGGYRHVTLVNHQPNASAVPLTSGTFVVTDLLGWDETNNLVYYTATLSNNSAAQHVFSLSLTQQKIYCLSCGLRNSISETECTYNTAEMSKDSLQYVLNCEGPGIPESTLYAKGKRLAIWENNAVLQRSLKNILLPTTEKHTFSVGDGLHADALIQLPPNMDRSGKTKYPLLVNVYAGPDSSQVTDKFTMDWSTYLTSNKKFAHVVIDGRGSGLKGDKHLFSINRKFGTVEIADQIDITRQLQRKLPFIDGNKTAIWGWSYGGFASSTALATDKEKTFKCAIAVAPVTDWSLYDSIYTERFMGLPTPDDNLKGYIDSQLYSKHEGLRDKQYFLIHGTLDDNVHFQQSLLWAKVLEQRDILFREMSYADEDHNLVSVRPHLYHSMEKFLVDCFKS